MVMVIVIVWLSWLSVYGNGHCMVIMVSMVIVDIIIVWLSSVYHHHHDCMVISVSSCMTSSSLSLYGYQCIISVSSVYQCIIIVVDDHHGQ